MNPLTQAQINWLLFKGVTTTAMVNPIAMLTINGIRAADGRFDEDPDGPAWFAFEEPEDVVFWRPKTGELATDLGRAFALGEEAIYAASTFSFDCHLNIFASPLDWLRRGRDGILVLDWSRAFDSLRDCPRIAVSEDVLFQYRRHMKPARMPEVFVIPSSGRAAA